MHCSDLKRSIDTTFYAMAFPNIQEINFAKELREINFGTHEGLHFDNLPSSEKKRFSDPNFQAVGGESWSDVRKRATQYFAKLEGQHIVFTHGGLITSYLY
jgi:broad specificity phosphatase PhoE